MCFLAMIVIELNETSLYCETILDGLGAGEVARGGASTHYADTRHSDTHRVHLCAPPGVCCGRACGGRSPPLLWALEPACSQPAAWRETAQDARARRLARGACGHSRNGLERSTTRFKQRRGRRRRRLAAVAARRRHAATARARRHVRDARGRGQKQRGRQ